VTSPIPDKFDPACISWVTDNIGITAVDGVEDAQDQGCFVINVAAEIDNTADVKVAIEPHTGTVFQGLNEVALCMRKALEEEGRDVVVHCAMGMERSVLSVVWYLHVENDMTIDEAYSVVRQARPIALDRRRWIYS